MTKVATSRQDGTVIATEIDQEAVSGAKRTPPPRVEVLLYWACAIYAAFHVYTLNFAPVETWTFRILHVMGACAIVFILLANVGSAEDKATPASRPLHWLDNALVVLLGSSTVAFVIGNFLPHVFAIGRQSEFLVTLFAAGLFTVVAISIVSDALRKFPRDQVPLIDWCLVAASVLVTAYMLTNRQLLEFRFGVVPTAADMWVALTGVILVVEMTRRASGWVLPIISFIFVAFAFLGPWLPGFLAHRGYSPERFFTYIFGLDGVFGVTTGVSSTYLIIFIIFAAFLHASKVGNYFVNCAFAIAGASRGGPAKAAVVASGMMGTVSGAAAGNVAATGSFTIPLMRSVGYGRTSAGAIEAAASTGGQILPPIMGSGAFIMAEITGIPYRDLIIAAAIPGVLYFLSVLFMVDNEALKLGLRGLPRNQLPRLSTFINRIYLFIPLIILVAAVFMGYSVLRAGSMALAAAVIVSWINPESRLGPRGIIGALQHGTRMSLQLIAVCACAGIIVGVIALTGVGLRFSNMLFAVSQDSELLALIMAMLISILLGMGMPTTAAYAVAASVVAPGLVRMGIEPLVAHLFVFYYAVISSITPPVALAAYAAAAISGASPLATAVAAFKLGLAAFIVPFMFFYSPGLLLQGEWYLIVRSALTATLGVYMLAAAVQGWFMGSLRLTPRILAAICALLTIYGGLWTDLIGLALVAVLVIWQAIARRHGKLA